MHMLTPQMPAEWYMVHASGFRSRVVQLYELRWHSRPWGRFCLFEFVKLSTKHGQWDADAYVSPSGLSTVSSARERILYQRIYSVACHTRHFAGYIHEFSVRMKCRMRVGSIRIIISSRYTFISNFDFMADHCVAPAYEYTFSSSRRWPWAASPGCSGISSLLNDPISLGITR